MTLQELKQAVSKALDNAGYDVAEGVADLFDIASTEKLIPAFNTCFGNNPAAPYIVPAVPHKAGEAYDYGESMQSDLNKDLYWTYRLEEHEAILMFGNLPPEAAFIGYETFLFTRYFDGENLPSPEMDWLTHTIGLQHHLSPDPDNLLYDHAPIGDEKAGYTNDENRVILFANGPTINRRTFEERMGEDFWGQQAILSTSPDAGFEAALNKELGEALADIHFHSPIGEEFRAGLTRHHDDLWTLMRYAVPKPSNKEESEKWRETVANQLVVFRVSKKVPETVDRHPIHVFPAKQAKSERNLAADLQKLADAVGNTLGFEDSLQEVCLPCSTIPLHAPHTIPMAMSAVGATHDADYRISSARYFPSGDTLAVVGVNHTETDNASYISLGLYNSEVWQGIRAISQGRGYSGPLKGSVDRFFQALDGVPAELAGIDRSKFYVHILTRPGTTLAAKLDDTLCTVIDEEEGDLAEGDVFLVPEKKLRISERAYLNPNASCGPDHTKLLSMIVVSERPETPGKPAKRGRRSSR